MIRKDLKNSKTMQNPADREREPMQRPSKRSSSSGAGESDRPLLKRMQEKKDALMGKGSQDNDFAFDGEVLMPKQSSKVMRFAVIFSVLFHAAFMMVKFADPVKISNLINTTALDVILVNVETPEKPTEAKLFAQADLAGGGEAMAENLVATSPDEYSPEESPGDSWEDVVMQQNMLRAETVRQLTSAKEAFALLEPIDPNWGNDDPRRIAEEERRRQLSNRIAAIEQRIQEESSRPRRMYIGPAARSNAQAAYYDMIRKQIELKGTESFPLYNGVPMYGELLMEVAVNPEGQINKALILESSGNGILDRRAEAIAISAGPFPPAPPALLKAEPNVEFVFIMRFKFLNDGRIETELRERSYTTGAR